MKRVMRVFLNKAMADFNITLDLAKLTKKRALYIFSQWNGLFYAVYLSEKIGYWRYSFDSSGPFG